VCSWEHNAAISVLPGTQSSDICAPGSTIQRYVCSRGHNLGIRVLPGAQSRDICARGMCALSVQMLLGGPLGLVEWWLRMFGEKKRDTCILGDHFGSFQLHLAF